MKGVREAFGRITSVVLLLVSLGLLVALPRWRADLLSSDRPSYSIERGRILVARPLVRSKTFSRTTIVLLEHDATRGTSGVILNRPPDSELDPPVHDGGPVNREGIVGLVVGDPAPAGAETVLGVTQPPTYTPPGTLARGHHALHRGRRDLRQQGLLLPQRVG